MVQKDLNGKHEIHRRSKEEEDKHDRKEAQRLQAMEKEKQRIEKELNKRHSQQQKKEIKAKLLAEKKRKQQELKENRKKKKENENEKQEKGDFIFEIFKWFKKREKAGQELNEKNKKSKSLVLSEIRKLKGSDEKLEAERLRVNDYQRNLYERRLSETDSKQKKQRFSSESESSAHESDLDIKWCGACKRPKKITENKDDTKEQAKLPPTFKEEIEDESKIKQSSVDIEKTDKKPPNASKEEIEVQPKLKQSRELFDIPKEISKLEPINEVKPVSAVETDKAQIPLIPLQPVQNTSRTFRDEATLVTPTLSLTNQDLQKIDSIKKNKEVLRLQGESSVQTDEEFLQPQSETKSKESELKNQTTNFELSIEIEITDFRSKTAEKPVVSKKEAIIQTDDVPETLRPISSLELNEYVEEKIYVRDQKNQTEPFGLNLSTNSTEKMLVPTGKANDNKIINKSNEQNAETQTSFCNCFEQTPIMATNLREAVSKHTGENVTMRSIAIQTDACNCNYEDISSSSSCYL